MYFCGLWSFPSLPYKLDSNRIRVVYADKLGVWDATVMTQLMLDAANLWAKYADLEFSSQTGDVTIYAKTCHIDGPTGTLAWSMLGMPGMRIVNQCYDASEFWIHTHEPREGHIDIFTVLVHEIGHALGLPHTNEHNNVMYPSYVRPMRDLGSWDISQIVSRYGERKKPSPKPNGGDGGMEIFRTLCKYGIPILQALCASIPKMDTSTGTSNGQCCAESDREYLRQWAEVFEQAAKILRQQAGQ